ncbi:tetraacyldisaccharide 4'-kinase [Synergistales bacterium]|nr:tetraacyldisaccharide 4'-kinase [Synergistales bacterium]
MPDILGSYLKYARGDKRGFSPWSLLNFAGKLFSPFVKLRNALYDRGVLRSTDPPIPVISVGNLCHGGTNKTPMVEMLARRLTETGFSVGIVSRGYGGKTKAPLLIREDMREYGRELVGDEPLMLAIRLPEVKVVVARSRLDGVRFLRELGAEVVVADDAFQHRHMGRDADIVLIDATCPFGSGRLFPSGILREHKESLSRSDIAIITKSEQIPLERLAAIRSELAKWLPPERIFTARLALESWMILDKGGADKFEPPVGLSSPYGKFIAFSAIGHPDSFHSFLTSLGMDVAEKKTYRDHHRFSWRDINDLERVASEAGADGFVCTEKDVHNMPDALHMTRPLYIPRITVRIDDEESFFCTLAEVLEPNFVVTSNGYGEDAIGVILASRLKSEFPAAEVSAFTLVGSGKPYRDRGIDVISPPSELPSGGVIKYSLNALLGDMRHGLRDDIKKQIAAWRARKRRCRTPLCVGDVYLLAITLWGRGLAPLLAATAKSVHLSGHWGIERLLLRRRAVKVWTRDAETARDLVRARVNASFAGSPIMDIAEEEGGENPWDADVWREEDKVLPRVLLLPGSRSRAYDDVSLLLEAVRLLDEKKHCRCVMVLAATIDRERLISGLPYDFEGCLNVGGARVFPHDGSIAAAARGADILIGLGGTANQVSAGLGVPVVSILEKGKLVQKKLLRDAELLVAPKPEALAEAAADLLGSPAKLKEMSDAGIKALGGAGAIAAIVEYAANELGWRIRCEIYEKLRAKWVRARHALPLSEPAEPIEPDAPENTDADSEIAGAAAGRPLRASVNPEFARIARIIKRSKRRRGGGSSQ